MPDEFTPNSPRPGSEEGLEELRRQLAEARAEADEFRRTTYALLGQLFPYTPPTEEELQDLLHGPRGKPLNELLDEYERELSRGQS